MINERQKIKMIKTSEKRKKKRKKRLSTIWNSICMKTKCIIIVWMRLKKIIYKTLKMFCISLEFWYLHVTITWQKQLFIWTIYSKYSYFRNKVISSPICNWMIILWNLHLHWAAFSNHFHYIKNLNNYKMLMRILHSS